MGTDLDRSCFQLFWTSRQKAELVQRRGVTDAEACSGCSHGANKQAGGPVDKLKMGGRY